MRPTTRIFSLWLLFSTAFFSCNNDPPEQEPELEPCELYATGIYKDTLPGKVPQKFWTCMKTEDLVDAGSYNFSSIFQLMNSNLQSGYNFCRSRYPWYVELETREDAFEYLLVKYISIDTINYDLSLDPLDRPGYKFYTYNLEVLLAQKVYLEDANSEQKVMLINELFKKQALRNAGHIWGSNEGTTFVMSRILYYDGYEPLLDTIDQNIQIKNLVDLGDLYAHNDGLKVQLLIFSLINDYLEELKTNKK
jgi:hypothetical protein